MDRGVPVLPAVVARDDRSGVATCVRNVARTPDSMITISYSPIVRDYRIVEDQFKGESRSTIEFELFRMLMDPGGLWEVEREFVRGKLRLLGAIMRAKGVVPNRVVFFMDHEMHKYPLVNDITRPILCHSQ